LTVGLDDALAEIHRKGGRHDPFDVYTNLQVALNDFICPLVVLHSAFCSA
jgi:hypothetical protein